MEPFLTLKSSLPSRGFTLAELIVVLAIISLLLTIVISGQGDFNRSLIVTDTAYTVALSIRLAQNYGLSSRSYSTFTNAGYGIHFDTTSPTTYLMFGDVDKTASIPTYCPVGTVGQPDEKKGNCLYDAGKGEIAQNYSFNRGFKVTEFCGKNYSTGAILCSTFGATPLTGLDIVYIRPNTSSVITGFDSGGTTRFSDAQIKLSAPNADGVRYICVSQAGQVSVRATACP